MKQCHFRIVGDEVKFHFLKAAEHHDVFDHACRRLAADPHKLEAVAMQMERMDVVTGIAKLEPIAAPFVNSVQLVSIEKASPLRSH